ncbi:hypothetical protein ACJW31_09G152700 [Castanea mollissima]
MLIFFFRLMLKAVWGTLLHYDLLVTIGSHPCCLIHVTKHL